MYVELSKEQIEFLEKVIDKHSDNVMQRVYHGNVRSVQDVRDILAQIDLGLSVWAELANAEPTDPNECITTDKSEGCAN